MKKDNGKPFKGKFSPKSAGKGFIGRKDKYDDRQKDKKWGDRPKATRTEKPVAKPTPAQKARQEPTSIKAAPTPRLKIDLFGIHAVMAAIKNPKRRIHNIYVTDRAVLAGTEHPAVKIVIKEQLDRSLPTGSVHQGIAMSCDPLPETGVDDFVIAAQARERTVLVMLDQVTDPHNVGAILRSACAFGASGIILQRMHAPELTGVLAKTACGAVEHVPVAYETNLSRAIETLQEAGFMVVGLDERGTAELSALSDHPKLVIVLGAESEGLRRLVKEHCDALVALPTQGPIASLNVSNAAAVALFAAVQGR